MQAGFSRGRWPIHSPWRIGSFLLGILSILISLYLIWALPSSKNFKARPLNFSALTKSLQRHCKDPGLVDTFSSAWFGSLSDLFGRRRVLFAGILIMLFGALLTLPWNLAIKIIGITIFTFGLFGAHSIASGERGSFRAKEDRALASSLYLFAYITSIQASEA